MQKRAKVADVAVVIDRRSAAIKAERSAISGVKRFDLSSECVEELKRHAII
jgi:hypothetical protein